MRQYFRKVGGESMPFIVAVMFVNGGEAYMPVQCTCHLERSDRVHVGGNDRNAGVFGLRMTELILAPQFDLSMQTIRHHNQTIQHKANILTSARLLSAERFGRRRTSLKSNLVPSSTVVMTTKSIF